MKWKNGHDSISISSFEQMKETKKYPGFKLICEQDKLIHKFAKGLLHGLNTVIKYFVFLFCFFLLF